MANFEMSNMNLKLILQSRKVSEETNVETEIDRQSKIVRKFELCSVSTETIYRRTCRQTVMKVEIYCVESVNLHTIWTNICV